MYFLIKNKAYMVHFILLNFENVGNNMDMYEFTTMLLINKTTKYTVTQ